MEITNDRMRATRHNANDDEGALTTGRLFKRPFEFESAFKGFELFTIIIEFTSLSNELQPRQAVEIVDHIK